MCSNLFHYNDKPRPYLVDPACTWFRFWYFEVGGCANMDIMTNKQTSDFFAQDDEFDDLFPSGILDELHEDYKDICNSAFTDEMFDELMQQPSSSFGDNHGYRQYDENDAFGFSNLNTPLYDEYAYQNTDIKPMSNMLKTEYMTSDDGVYSNAQSPTELDIKPVIKTTKKGNRAADKRKKVRKPKKERTDEKYYLNGHYKPVLPYACLVGLALKNAPNGILSVAEIYHFVIYNFPFFEYAPSGWKNSIRHNLSLNPCFAKIEVETNTNRKSCLWMLRDDKKKFMDDEIVKHEADKVQKAMRLPDNYDQVVSGAAGMPPGEEIDRLVTQEKEHKQARAAMFKQCRETERAVRPEDLESEFSDYGRDYRPTARQHAERHLEHLLTGCSSSDTIRSVSRPVIRTLIKEEADETPTSSTANPDLKRKHQEDREVILTEVYEPPPAPKQTKLSPFEADESTDSTGTDPRSEFEYSSLDDNNSQSDTSDSSRVYLLPLASDDLARRLAAEETQPVGMFNNFMINRPSPPASRHGEVPFHAYSTRPSGRPMMHYLGTIENGYFTVHGSTGLSLARTRVAEEAEVEQPEEETEVSEEEEFQDSNEDPSDKENICH
uniref:Fork-head domain-containing protein n=1 Tax=Panagrellus redivivus TaxID=6233 RepID=A0A7E4W469_PANRE